MALTDEERAYCRSLLGLGDGATPDEIKKAYMQKSYAQIRQGASADDREQLKLAQEALLGEFAEQERQRLGAELAAAKARAEERQTDQLVAAAELEEAREREEVDPTLPWYDPRSFQSWPVNAVMPPLVSGLAILVSKTPLAFLLSGFLVWVHEFGHATAAWMTGRRALPLPIGWTSIGPERSTFVYFGVLFLLTVLFIAGARERKVLPMLAAVGLALAQYVMTWKWPEEVGYKWSVFAGAGGELYLSAAAIVLFYFRLPAKFQWGICRYFFLGIGAISLAQNVSLWNRIKRGEEGIPYGSMIGGEDDAGGDMNILHDEFRWSQHDIINTYHSLGRWCLVVIVVVYLIFLLRVDRLVARLLPRKET